MVLSPLTLRGVQLWNPEFWSKEILMLLHRDRFSRVIWLSPSEAWGAGAPSVLGALIEPVAKGLHHICLMDYICGFMWYE